MFHKTHLIMHKTPNPILPERLVMRSPDMPRISRSDIQTDSAALPTEITPPPLTNTLFDREVVGG
jgi:hypothetical protein